MTGRFGGPKLLAAKATDTKFGSDFLNAIFAVAPSTIASPDPDRIVTGWQVCHQGLEAVVRYVQQLLASGVGSLTDLVAYHQQTPVYTATFNGSPVNLLNLRSGQLAIPPGLITVPAEYLNLAIEFGDNDEMDFERLQQIHQLGIIKAGIGPHATDPNVPGQASEQFEHKIGDIVAASGVAWPQPESHYHFGLGQNSDQRVMRR